MHKKFSNSVVTVSDFIIFHITAPWLIVSHEKIIIWHLFAHEKTNLANFCGCPATPINRKPNPTKKSATSKVAYSYQPPIISSSDPLGAWVKMPNISSNNYHSNVNKSNNANADSHSTDYTHFLISFNCFKIQNSKSYYQKNFKSMPTL